MSGVENRTDDTLQPAILTAGTLTITTTLSFSSTVTKTITRVSPTVIKQRVDAPVSAEPTQSQVEPPVQSGESEQIPAPEQPTVTIQLDQVTRSVMTVSVTETKTNLVYEMRTMTP